MVGAAASVVVLILRYTGILIEPAAIVVVVLCFVFSPGPKRVAERFLLLFALGFGWLPLLGWVPGIGTAVDVPGIVLAIAVGVTCGYQVHLGHKRARTVALPTLPEIMALITGGVVTLWWARPLVRLSESGRLQWLFTGWDNNTHFSIFQQNVQLGSFIHVRRALPGGSDRLGYDYPQGMHQAWAQLVRMWNPHPPMTTAWLLNAYLVMLLLTTGSIVVVLCMAISRLCRRDLFSALPAMAVVVALFGVGRFAPFNGFPNYELAIAAGAVGVSLMVRPTFSPRVNFFAVAGMGLIVVYNWYPLILLVAPAVVFAALRARSASTGRARHLTTVGVVAVAIAYVMPFTLFIHRGAQTLNETGGGISPPWGVLTVCLAALIGFAIVRQTMNPDWTTNLVIAAPAILGAGTIAFLAYYEVRGTGTVAYYGQKFAAGVFAMTLTVLVCVAAGDVAKSHFRLKLSKPMAIFGAAVISVAALQIDGFVGPYNWTNAIGGYSYSTIDAAGIILHNNLIYAPVTSAEAQSVLEAAQMARAKGSGQWWYIDPVSANSFAFFAEWFAVLRGDPTQQEYDRVGDVLAPSLDEPPTPDVAAQLIIQDFPNPSDGRVHLFVSSYIRGAIIGRDPAWGRPGALLTIQTP
jgi:hypothetical protein